MRHRRFGALILSLVIIAGTASLLYSTHSVTMSEPETTQPEVTISTTSPTIPPPAPVVHVISTNSQGGMAEFPDHLTAQRWTSSSPPVTQSVTFGAEMQVVDPGAALCPNVAPPSSHWNVWCDGPAQFPVTYSGRDSWSDAGPLLATDWAGGSLYIVTHVTSCSTAVAAMVGQGVVDTTFDGGRQWYQFGSGNSMAGYWSMSVESCPSNVRGSADSMTLRVTSSGGGDARDTGTATYVTRDDGQYWQRASYHLG
jgi:hypothetical protein